MKKKKEKLLMGYRFGYLVAIVGIVILFLGGISSHQLFVTGAVIMFLGLIIAVAFLAGFAYFRRRLLQKSSKR